MITNAVPPGGGTWVPTGSLSAAAAHRPGRYKPAGRRARRIGGVVGARTPADHVLGGTLKDVAQRWRAGWVSVVVSESVLLACLLGSITIHAALAWWTTAATRHQGEVLGAAVLHVERHLDAATGATGDLPDLADIAEAVQTEVTATIEDVLGQVELPTAGDHIAGALAQGLQWFIGMKQQEAMAKNPAFAAMLGAVEAPGAVEDTQGAQGVDV